MKAALCALSAALLTLSGAVVLSAQMKAGPQEAVLSKADALKLVRTIATAEAEKKNLENRGHVALKDLATPGFLQQYLGGKNQRLEITHRSRLG